MSNKAVIALTDTEIIDKVISGDKQLYEHIIRKNNPVLYKIGRSYGLSHDDVEDCMQETFIAAYLNLGKFERKSAFPTWLIRIMINNCLKKLRKEKGIFTDPLSHNEHEKNEDMREETVSFSFNHTERHFLRNELSKIMEKAIEQLPDSLRLTFILREVEGYSVLETANALNITETNVKVRTNRAKEILKGILEKWYSRAEIYEFNLMYCDRIVEKVMSKI